MFANLSALEVLISADVTASEHEKNLVLGILRGRLPSDAHSMPEREVVSFDEAMHILGFKSKHAVYAAIQRGVLKGCSCGVKSKRSYGVTMESIRQVLKGK